MGKKENKNIHYHHYNWDGIIIQLLVFLVVVIVLGWVSATVNEPKYIYNSCVDGCSKKYFNDYTIGKNFASDTSVTGDKNRMIIYKPTIKEFDRTNCMMNCNLMLVELKK